MAGTPRDSQQMMSLEYLLLSLLLSGKDDWNKEQGLYHTGPAQGRFWSLRSIRVPKDSTGNLAK
jgi:hypothetical protein